MRSGPRPTGRDGAAGVGRPRTHAIPFGSMSGRTHTWHKQKLRRPWLMTVTGTYRLQLHEGFGFADAQAQLPYLA